MGRRTRYNSIRVVALLDLLRTPDGSWIVLSIVVRHRTHIPLAGSPIKQAISAALYIGVIPISYHSLPTAMVMIAAVAVLWLIPPRGVLETTKEKRRNQ